MSWISRIRQSLPPIGVPSPETFADGISSVLIAVGFNRATQREDILLTKRTMLVESHKGQVSFPGGFWEAHDASLVQTALRECQEEIGTQPEHIQVVGGLPPVQTHQGVYIYPWVGLMDFPYPFALSAAEVEKVIFLPVQSLLDDGLKPVTVKVGEIRVVSEGIYAENELVWGATARILDQLRRCLLNQSHSRP